MANDSDYTITTLSNNLNQRNKPVFSQAVNNSVSLRDKCSPYTLVAVPEGHEDIHLVKFPFGCLTSSPCSYPVWIWDGREWSGDVCLKSYAKFDPSELAADQSASIKMTNWGPLDGTCPDPANWQCWATFGSTNNPGWLKHPPQTASMAINSNFFPTLYRGYPVSVDQYYFTGSIKSYKGKNAYVMSSSQVSSWEPYVQTYAASHNMGYAYPSPDEDASVTSLYEPLDTNFSLSLWYRMDRIAWGAEGGYRLYGNIGLFCIGASGMGNLTGESYFGVSFGSSSYMNKYFMEFGYGDSGYNGDNWHVYSDAGGGASGIADTESWHHIVLSVSGSSYDNRTGTFYYDGAPLTCSLVNRSAPASTTLTKDFDFSTTAAPSTDDDCRILLFNNLRGGSPMDYGFPGAITEFAYYSGSLGENQVAELYNCGYGADARYISPKRSDSSVSCIPESIAARENLIHWWKLTEDPAEGAARDLGTSATAATNLAVVDASTTAGPASLGSPTVFSFDGTNDIVKTQIIDASGTKNSIADLFDTNYYTISFWMKDNGVVSDDVCWTTSGFWTSNTLRDGGQGFFNDGGGGLYIYWRTNVKHYLKGTGNTGWKHYAIVTDLRTVSGVDSVGIGYVDGVANPDTTLQDGNPHYSSYVAGAKNYWFAIGGLASGSLGAGVPDHWAAMDMCDFRMYDRVLTPTEITTIAAGDW